MITWRQTLLKATSCPFRCKAIVEKRGSGSGTPEAELGTVVHAFAKLYIDECRALERTTNTSSVDKLVRKAIAEHPLQAKLEAAASELAWNLADTFWIPVTAYGGAEWGLEASEEWNDDIRSTWKHGVQSVRWKGTLDLAFQDLDNNLWIIDDWKTGWRLPTQAECEADIQLPFYASLILSRNPDVSSFKLRYEYLRYRKAREFIVSAEEIREIWRPRFKEMAAFGDSFETVPITETPAAPGSHCDWCETPSLCPIGAENVGVIIDEQHAEAAAAQYRILKQQISVLETKLKAWCDKYGKVQVGDQAVGFWPWRSKGFPDTKQVLDTVVRAGVPEAAVWEELTLTQAAVKRLLPKKQWKELREKVFGLLEESVSSRFTIKRRQDADQTPEPEKLALP